MFVLGTSGHVDHGKSSFLRALTGQEPDRLPEERQRGMTIDLNFVWVATRWGKVGIVDVPGHQRFVKNMISGVASIDAFLFLVAADDGWMPQSEEHLGVLKGLGVSTGIGIVSKVDLVEEARAREVEQRVGEKLKMAFGRAFPVLRFSTRKHELLAPIRSAIDVLLEALSPPQDVGAARLWIDRVFVPKGLGVVVTGTLREGPLSVGDEVAIFPSGQMAEVKGVQSYHESVRVARPVCRVAVQLSKVAASAVSRGMLLQKGRPVTSTKAVDCRLQWFEPGTGRERRVSVYLGTLREQALALKLSPELCRLRFVRPLPLRALDRVVLRTVGEERTLAAGWILDPLAAGSRKATLFALQAWQEGARGFLSFQAKKSPILELSKCLAASPYSLLELEEELQSDRYLTLGGGRFVDKGFLVTVRATITQALGITPLAPEATESSLVKAVAKSLAVPERVIRAVLPLLVREGAIHKDAKWFRLSPAREVSGEEQRVREQVMVVLRTGQGQPVSLRELFQSKAVKNAAYALVKEQRIVSLGEDHFLFAADYEKYRDKVVSFLKQKGQGSTGDLRTFLGLSRKNAVLVLEQMDRDRVTYLKDNVRRLFRP